MVMKHMRKFYSIWSEPMPMNTEFDYNLSSFSVYQMVLCNTLLNGVSLRVVLTECVSTASKRTKLCTK